jgi:hypothetical protein
LRWTGGQGCDIYVARAYKNVRAGLERSREFAAQWPPWACAQLRLFGIACLTLRAALKGVLHRCAVQCAAQEASGRVITAPAGLSADEKLAYERGALGK